MLGKKHLNYAGFPKGLVPFHKYAKYTRTAFEEQLFEATQYAAVDGVAHLHFTFSPKHLDLFKMIQTGAHITKGELFLYFANLIKG